MPPIITKWRKAFLILIIIASLAVFYFIKESATTEIVVSKIVVSIFFMLYFLVTLKKSNYLLTLSLLLFFLSTILFSLQSQSVIGMILLLVYRLTLIKFAFNRKVDWKLFLTVFVIASSIISLLFVLIFKNTLFYYLSISTTLVLVGLISLAFTNIITRSSSKDILFFVAIALFVVCDMVFGAKKIENADYINIIVGTALYYISFFLIVKSQELEFIKD
ncbi:hypothetical protein WH52_03170 [Tenacibaculum holothuriorum]|uniref:YhhN-like protein n=1 Tax=Tenacibaculum holothuriorum TaxID=1635173 RepID=A0A1Y2PDZ6_9FLAO|nr:hypothetical protein [Tenacibaculum holothuriorum]OSY88692.1 hypothetical protein WH52_03170 [Tenacibaculum holothuriorum]